jgi:ABC-2 type transport system permease protein
MKKLWAVIRYEYTRHVMRRGFLIAVFSVPLWVLIITVVGVILVWVEADDRAVGYIDHSGILANPQPLPERDYLSRPIPLLAFENENSARQALEAGDIQAYYVVPADFWENGELQLFFIETPGSIATEEFIDFLRLNLLSDLPADIRERVIEGADVHIVTLSEELEASGFSVLLKLLVPAFSGMTMMIAIFTSSGYLMQAVVDEKENRTMEILITSVSPSQMMAGKVIGLIGVGLTQILVWLLIGLAGLTFLIRVNPVFSAALINPGNLGLAIGMIFPAFVMISALMAAIGATVTEAREGSQITGLVTLPVMLPFMFFGILIEQPNGILALAMSFFPLTAPLSMIIRASFTVIPTWQILTSEIILVLSAAGSLWLAGKIFRLGMLRYGQRVPVREILQIFQPARLRVNGGKDE